MNSLTETNLTMTEQTIEQTIEQAIDKFLVLAESEETILNRKRRYELQDWLICLDYNSTNNLIGILVHKIESTPEMTITQFVESMKTLIAKEEAQ